MSDGSCLTLADGDTYVFNLMHKNNAMSFAPVFFRTAGGSLSMQACSATPEGSDGRTVFAAQSNGQLKMPKLGNYCLTVLGEAAAKADIASGADLSAAQYHDVLFIGFQA